MAQSFQDLTGQIIKRVITLVDDVEASLVNLVKLSSSQIAESSSDDSKQKSDKSKLEGPQIPGKETDGAVSGQDEVDDLLSSLGF
jgi:chemotaxis protein CheZ